MLETVDVGDKIRMLMIDLRRWWPTVTNIIVMQLQFRTLNENVKIFYEFKILKFKVTNDWRNKPFLVRNNFSFHHWTIFSFFGEESSRCFHGKHLKKSKCEVENDFESEKAKPDVNKVLKTRASYFKSLLLHSFTLGTHSNTIGDH